MENNNLIRCSQISVDCAVNDPVDVRSGGPAYLGFNFNVREEHTEDIIKFIIAALKVFEVPLINIDISGVIDLDEMDVWTKEKVFEAIKKDAKYLQDGAKRNYSTNFGRK